MDKGPERGFPLQQLLAGANGFRQRCVLAVANGETGSGFQLRFES